MERTIYTREDCGCYGDGSYGVPHVNASAMQLAIWEGWLGEDDPDDMDAADDALAYLNTNCVEAGISFQFIDGDLLLIADDEAE